jgi:hypothetical protein
MPKLSLRIDQANAKTQQQLQRLRDDLQPKRLALYSQTLDSWVSYPDGFSEQRHATS